MDLLSLSATELGRAIREGRTTAVEAMEAVFDRIKEAEPLYNCYVTVQREKALEKAREVQAKIRSGELAGPLAGVPMAVKDNLCTEGIATTCASRILENFVPIYSAEAVRNMEAAGAVLIGKTNMDEFAMGSTTETSAYGPTRNPRNPEHVPGGSSGGSAAAVAAGECFFALGSDTGGSVRQPASHCGVVGMKPTYGTVSRYGLVAYGSSLDQVGPLCKTVEDCAVILELLAMGSGTVRDSTFLGRKNIDFTFGLTEDVKGMRIGIPNEYIRPDNGTEDWGRGGPDPEVRHAVLKAAELLRKKGAIVEQFDLGLAEYAIPAYYTIASAEASSNLERFDGIKYGFRAGDAEDLHSMYRETRSWGFGAEVRRRIMLGCFVLSSGYYDAYYLKALRVKALIKKSFTEAFAEYDCILGPTAPSTAPVLGESLGDPIKMYLGDIYTISANLAGLPAISIPCGTDGKGLPVGLQLTGDCYQEKKLLQIAYTYEQARNRCETGD